MLTLLALFAALAQAQIVSVSSVESNSIPLSGETITDSSTTQTVHPIGPLTPTLTGLSTAINITDSPVVPTHTVPLTIHSSGCVTVTAAGEPVYTIQTNTALESGCTFTVYGNATAPAGGNGTVITTTRSGSASLITVTGSASLSSAGGAGSGTTTASSSTTSNPAATMGVAKAAGLGAMGLGAAVLLL